jgi:putative PIN family toxin of toxin-antitoxin system
MIEGPRVVLDTNALVSHLLRPNSTAGRPVRLAMANTRVLASDATMTELADVLSRRKFDPYVTVRERQTFLRLLLALIDQIPVLPVIQACRDPKDDKFLELAVAGAASFIVTGDADLLALHPFRGVHIVTPAGFLAEFGATHDSEAGAAVRT